MRLINTKTLELHEFEEAYIPINEYAILSHRWEGREISYKDFIDPNLLHRTDIASSWQKVKAFCNLSFKLDIEWAWADTCCIDKSSSEELSEAINSMYRWYKDSKICIVYMKDVHSVSIGEDFGDSTWFTRGWTLQELIAPDNVVFYDSSWEYICSKREQCLRLSELTKVPTPILYSAQKYPVHLASVAQRMSWAAARRVTRTEDMAYCLLGLFDVNIPLLYGEGGVKAFRRLQLEILRESNVESIFAFGDFEYDAPLFACSPSDFNDCQDVVASEEPKKPTASYALTNNGLEIKSTFYTWADVWSPKKRNPLRTNKGDYIRKLDSSELLLVLDCTLRGNPLALLLTQQDSRMEKRYFKSKLIVLPDQPVGGKHREILVEDTQKQQSSLDFNEAIIRLSAEVRDDTRIETAFSILEEISMELATKLRRDVFKGISSFNTVPEDSGLNLIDYELHIERAGQQLGLIGHNESRTARDSGEFEIVVKCSKGHMRLHRFLELLCFGEAELRLYQKREEKLIHFLESCTK